jgi:hypothetical protein
MINFGNQHNKIPVFSGIFARSKFVLGGTRARTSNFLPSLCPAPFGGFRPSKSIRPPLTAGGRCSKGVTLVELLIYMGLLAILLVILTEMLVSILNVRLESEAVSSVEQDGRFIISRFAYDIARADSIASPATPGDAGNTLVLNISGDTYTYLVSGTDLQLTNPMGTMSLNGSETLISDMTFQRLGSVGKRNSIKLQFTVTSVTRKNSGQEVKVFGTTVGVRQ